MGSRTQLAGLEAARAKESDDAEEKRAQQEAQRNGQLREVVAILDAGMALAVWRRERFTVYERNTALLAEGAPSPPKFGPLEVAGWRWESFGIRRLGGHALYHVPTGMMMGPPAGRIDQAKRVAVFYQCFAGAVDWTAGTFGDSAPFVGKWAERISFLAEACREGFLEGRWHPHFATLAAELAATCDTADDHAGNHSGEASRVL